MSTIATIVGWLVIWATVAVVVAVPLGRSLKFLGRKQPEPEPETWDPAPRNLTPHVPSQWKFSGSDLNDPREDPLRDTSPE